jgi:diguanylate cyclase (GGDEF)-like protein
MLTPDVPTSAFRTVIGGLAAVALVVGVRLQRPAVAGAWWLIVAGAVVGTSASSTRTAVLVTAGEAGRGDLWAQDLYALSFVLFIAGLALLVRLGGRAYVADTLDATLVALATFLLLFWLVIGTVTPPGDTSLLAEVVYPLGALVLFAMTVRVALSVGVPTVSLGLLLLSMVARVGATVSLLVPALTTGSMYGGLLTPYLGAASNLLLGAAALHPSLAATRVRRVRDHELVSRPRVLLFVLMALVGLTALVAETFKAVRGTATDMAVLVVGGSVLLVLIVARLALTAGVAQRWAMELTRRSDDLASAVREQEALQRQLRHQAMHDPLTGLPNRVVLTERLEWVLTRQSPAAHMLAVVDLDRFDDVNNTFGHPVGDAVLIEASHRLLAATPGDGMLARLVGDKFAVLLEDTGPEEARRWAQRARAAVREPYRVDDQELFLDPRIGLFPMAAPRPSPTATQALRGADLALRAARNDRGARIAIFSPELLTSQTYFSRLSNGLRRALARDELSLDYQPIVAIGTGRVVAAEALLRWNPPGAPATPSEFIPVAEQIGMMRPIGTWVLRTACRDARPWHDRYGMAVAVNVSAQQLEDPNFADLVDEVLDDAGLPGSALVLEITESILVTTASMREANRQLEKVRSRGVRVAIDDFGTGYSSLSYLTRLAVDVVKIDRSFVQQLDPGHGERKWAFTRAILHLVEAMGLSAIAEGVETPEQAVALRELRCPLAQGFLFGRPVPADALARALASADGPKPLTAARELAAPAPAAPSPSDRRARAA